MRIPRIYTSQELVADQHIELEEKPSHHLSKVLRLKEGAPIILFNGRGNQYHAIIDSIGKKNLSINIKECEATNNESPLHIHLGIAVSKGDRMDWVIQKATELGVNSISPLFSMRSEVRLKGDRAEKKIQHWQQVAISACEQSGRTLIPTVNNIQQLSHWVRESNADKKLVLHHRTDETLEDHQSVSRVALLIGPEGGLDTKEIMLAEESGFEALALGPRVLRTETAPLAAITLLQKAWGDF